mmetsp:Transcript_28353/g.87886  ORF Transcript_28353/g.87886 Transcript_28353/m.87886 type:complete len:229 (-) Transcript_28353:139-825(-)
MTPSCCQTRCGTSSRRFRCGAGPLGTSCTLGQPPQRLPTTGSQRLPRTSTIATSPPRPRRSKLSPPTVAAPLRQPRYGDGRRGRRRRALAPLSAASSPATRRRSTSRATRRGRTRGARSSAACRCLRPTSASACSDGASSGRCQTGSRTSHSCKAAPGSCSMMRRSSGCTASPLSAGPRACNGLGTSGCRAAPCSPTCPSRCTARASGPSTHAPSSATRTRTGSCRSL